MKKAKDLKVNISESGLYVALRTLGFNTSGQCSAIASIVFQALYNNLNDIELEELAQKNK